MIISDSHKFIFFHVPKSAGTSLACKLAPYSNNRELLFPYYELYIDEIQDRSKENSNQAEMSTQVQKIFSHAPEKYIAEFYKNNPEYVTWMHLPHFMFSPHPKIGCQEETSISKNLTYNAKKYSDFCKFAIVRNSWDYAFSIFKNKVVVDSVAAEWNETLDWDQMIENRMTKSNFLFFITNLENEYPQICDDFFFNRQDKKPFNQQVYFCDQDGNSFADYILRFENLDEDLKKISSALSIDLGSLPSLNKSSRRPVNHVDFYDNEAKKIVENIFKLDIERFGFKFGE